MMRWPQRTIGEPGPGADDQYLAVMIAYVVAQLLEAAGGHERGDRIDVGQVTAIGQCRCHGHHVLLGYAGVDETVAERRLQRLNEGEAEIAGDEQGIWILLAMR